MKDFCSMNTNLLCTNVNGHWSLCVCSNQRSCNSKFWDLPAISVPSKLLRWDEGVVSEPRRLASLPLPLFGIWVKELGSALTMLAPVASEVNIEANLDCLELESGVAKRLENWTEVVSSSAARRLARLSGREDTESRSSTLPRLGLGAMTWLLEELSLSADVRLGISLVVSRYLVAAEIAAAVKPKVREGHGFFGITQNGKVDQQPVSNFPSINKS